MISIILYNNKYIDKERKPIVVVLEKMTRLEDREEATRLAEEAKGRKALLRFTFDSALNSNFLLP